MADVQTSKVYEKPTPVSLGLPRVKFGYRYRDTHESIVVKQWALLLEPTFEQEGIV
jgi:hypothetical protein